MVFSFCFQKIRKQPENNTVIIVSIWNSGYILINYILTSAVKIKNEAGKKWNINFESKIFNRNCRFAQLEQVHKLSKEIILNTIFIFLISIFFSFITFVIFFDWIFCEETSNFYFCKVLLGWNKKATCRCVLKCTIKMKADGDKVEEFLFGAGDSMLYSRKLNK